MKVDESQYIEEGFEHLVEARHQAIYGGFGMDDWAFDQLINREDVYANVAARANNYKQFAYGILQDVLRGTTDLFMHIERQCPQELEKLLPKICAMVYTPPFDLRKDLPDTIGNEVNQVPSCQLWLSRILAQAT